MTFAPARLEDAIARLEALTDPAARETAREAVAAVVELHGDGLRRLVERLRGAGTDGDRTLQAVATDEVVASMLLLHGLHPLPLEDRVRRVLGDVRASDREGGGVEVVSIAEEAIRLRVRGSERFRRAVARAVEDAAPEVARIEVQLGPDPGLVPVERLTARRDPGHERCELCGQSLAAGHEHLFDVARRSLRCACTACSLLFDTPASSLRRVRRRAERLEDLHLSEAQWAALEVPVGLAFLSYASSLGEVIAAYPGPAGAVEAVVPAPAWREIVRSHPALSALEPDTAALLVDRLTPTPTYHILSIDECYRLVGAVRSRWQGLTGGDGAIHAVQELLGGLSGARS